jgi:hypothetical protein
MKQLQLGQLDLGRLRYVLLSALAGSHADLSENRIRSDRPVAERAPLRSSSTRTPEEILRITQRRRPSRYY